MNIKQLNREKTIIKTSVLGILANIFLSSFKTVIGLITNSIAIVLDAINNLTDALSSIITIIGTKIAGKAPDKKHPYGHGRVEYLSAMIIAAIIIYAGIASIIESIKNIIKPTMPDYSILSLVIVTVAIFIKIFLGIYFKKVGKKVNSNSLVGSGKDALMDAIISTATLISALTFIIFGLSLEAWLAAIISIYIVKTGIEMLSSTISQILGERIDSKLAGNIKNTINSFDEIKGAYDLVLSNYGPNTYLGSIHIEVDETMSAYQIDELTRKITKKIFNEFGVILAAVGIYAENTKNKTAIKAKEKIIEIISNYKSILQMHGFYINEKDKQIYFDIIIDFDDKDRQQVYAEIYEKVKKEYPDYKLNITMDIDFSD